MTTTEAEQGAIRVVRPAITGVIVKLLYKQTRWNAGYIGGVRVQQQGETDPETS